LQRALASAGRLYLIQCCPGYISTFASLSVCTAYHISTIGGAFKAPNSVGFGNTAFLITVPAANRPGVLFAYRTYIANANAMLVLQLWRPVTSGGQSRRFRLVDDLYFSPTRLGQEDVSLV